MDEEEKWHKYSKLWIVILFYLFSPFYNKRYWEKKKKAKGLSYYPEELFVFSSIGYITAIAVASLYPLIFGFIKHQEITSFNKICNANISFYDGIFLNLRVDNCFQSQKEIN